MSRLNDWQELSPYLDQALTLAGPAREAWLAALRRTDPQLCDRLRPLLEAHQALLQQEFLEEDRRPAYHWQTLVGQTIGAYTLISQVGEGGMSTVWRAERNDKKFTRQVAVKFLNISLTGTTGEHRFQREGQILGRITHPSIAKLLDAGVSSAGQPFLILEYVDGQHIDRYADGQRLDVEARVRLFLELLGAVSYAHRNLIVHRDIKPSNILVTREGHLKLLDFGISKLLTDEQDLIGWASRPVMTPAYAAPEQLQGLPITTSTDVYALGVLLHVLVTGCHPAGSATHSPADLVKAIVELHPPPASSIVTRSSNSSEFALIRSTTPEKLARRLKGDLDTIIDKALRKDQEERYASAAEFADDLQRFLRNEPVSARRHRAIYRAAKFTRRHRSGLALLCIGLFAILGSLADSLVQTRKGRLQRDLAFRQMRRAELVNEFNSFLLSDAAPSGKPLDVHELLRRAERIAVHESGPEPANDIELMVSIGRQYLEQDEAQSGRRVLEDAYQRSRKLSDVSVRARSACGLAASLARDEELGRAEWLFQEGLRALPNAVQFTFERMECLQSGSEVAEQRGDIIAAVARAESAQRVLRESPFQNSGLELRTWTELAKLYSSAGRDADSLAAFEKANVLLLSLGRDGTATAASFFNDWGLEMDQLGQPLAAEALLRRALEISRANQTNADVSPMILTNYARTVRELGRIAEAAECAEQAYQNAVRVGHQLAITQSLLERARVYNAANRVPRALAALAEVEPRLLRDLPPNHYAYAALAAAKGEARLRSGDLPSALALADQAVALNEAAIVSGAEGAFYFPTVLIFRSEVELAAKRFGPARLDAERALEQLRRTVPGDRVSCKTGKAYLNLGQALRAQGDTEEAQQALRNAVKHLEATLGLDHSQTRTARELLAVLIQQSPR